MKIRDFLRSSFLGPRRRTQQPQEAPRSRERPSQDEEILPPAFQPRAEGRLSAPWDQVGFALKLYREVKKRAPRQNVFISPVGLAVSLLLLHNGARGETRAEIERCLGLKESSREELNRAISTLIKEVNAVSDLELVLANSIWVHEQAGSAEFRSSETLRFFDGCQFAGRGGRKLRTPRYLADDQGARGAGSHDESAV